MSDSPSQGSDGDEQPKPSASISPMQLAQIAFAIVAGVLVYGFVEMAKQEEMRRACEPLVQMRPRYLGNDLAAPDFELSDGKGGKVKLSDYRGKAVILHFWTKTCEPCLKELPEVGEFAKLIEKRSDVALLTVTIDDGPESVKDVYASLFPTGVPFKVGYDPDASTVGGKFGTKLYPETWFIDRQGIIRARIDGVPLAGEGCGILWRSSLMQSVIDALTSPVACDIKIDAKADPRPEKLIAACRPDR